MYSNLLELCVREKAAKHLDFVLLLIRSVPFYLWICLSLCIAKRGGGEIKLDDDDENGKVTNRGTRVDRSIDPLIIIESDFRAMKTLAAAEKAQATNETLIY